MWLCFILVWLDVYRELLLDVCDISSHMLVLWQWGDPMIVLLSIEL